MVFGIHNKVHDKARYEKVSEPYTKATPPGTTTEAHVRATCFNNCKGKKYWTGL